MLLLLNIYICILLLLQCLLYSVSTIPEFFSVKKKIIPVKNGDDYGVDVTFPIHHQLDTSTEYGIRYKNMMQGCYNAYSKRECDMTEEQRIDQCLNQPKMHHNYTELGFKKMKVPDDIWKLILEFWNANKNNINAEQWPRGNTYTNHWESKTEFISIEDTTKIGGGPLIKEKIWNGLNPILSEWVGGEELIPTSLYGIRIYRSGSMLSTHVDRLPLITSAIIQVAQENILEPWPIEVYSHAGKAYNFTMKPGEMVLYESHTVLHGRPFPLNGDLYANIFVHFKPIRHDEINAGRIDPNIMLSNRNLRKASSSVNANHKDQHGYAQDHGHIAGEEDHDPISKFGGKKFNVKDDHELILNHRRKRELLLEKYGNPRNNITSNKILPTYITPILSPKLKNYLRDKDKENLQSVELEGSAKMRSILHQIAQNGDLITTKKLLKGKSIQEMEVLVNAQDSRGWQPIHETIRGAHFELMKYLIEECGASFETKTTGSINGTPLWWAKKLLDPIHPIIKYLTELGALDSGDEI